MKYNITQTENYLLIVDDSEIKKGDYTFQEASNLISKYNNAYSKKIISHLPLNNSPILEGVDLLPKIEDDIEQWGWNNPCLSRKDVYTLFEEVFKEQRLDGQFSISAAKQVYEFKSKLRDLAKIKAVVVKEKYKYTEEDLRKALTDKSLYELSVDEIIHSLQQPKMPVAFECHSTREFRIIDLSHQVYYEKVGRSVWVGKYIFND
jgi:hypothetical protein